MPIISNLTSSLTALAVGAALPGRDVPGSIVSNDALSAIQGEAALHGFRAGRPEPAPPCSPSFPEERLGIRNRHVADQGIRAVDLAVAAARSALSRAAAASGVDPVRIARRVRLVLVASVTGSEPAPAMAASVAGALDASDDVLATDLVLGCNGFVAALELARTWLAACGPDALAVVVGAETMSRVLDASDRETLPIFGDGAGAVVLQHAEGPARASGVDAPGFTTMARFGPRIRIRERAPAPWPLLRMTSVAGRPALAPAGGSQLVVTLEGRRVFRDMIRRLPGRVDAWLEQRGLSTRDFDHFAFHQANARLLEGVYEALDLPRERCLSNIASVANTTSASIPLLLDDASRSGRLRSGDRLLIVGFGAGYSIGVTSLSWQ